MLVFCSSTSSHLALRVNHKAIIICTSTQIHTQTLALTCLKWLLVPQQFLEIPSAAGHAPCSSAAPGQSVLLMLYGYLEERIVQLLGPLGVLTFQRLKCWESVLNWRWLAFSIQAKTFSLIPRIHHNHLKDQGRFYPDFNFRRKRQTNLICCFLKISKCSPFPWLMSILLYPWILTLSSLRTVTDILKCLLQAEILPNYRLIILHCLQSWMQNQNALVKILNFASVTLAMSLKIEQWTAK